MRSKQVDTLLRSAAKRSGVISFAGGLPSEETFPREALSRAAAEVVMEPHAASLQYGWPEGRLKLRGLIASRLRARGAHVTPDDVIVTNGAQEALGLVLEVLTPQDVQVDNTTYPGALDLFESHGFPAVAGERRMIRYAMPAIHNPTGWTMPDRLRSKLLDATVLIEDDAYADLRFDGPSSAPMLAHARGSVFHLGSFSKTVSPGLRVGYLVPPPQWLEQILRVKSDRNLQVGGIAQAIVERLLSSGQYDERLGPLRAHYRRRAETMMGAMPAMRGAHFAMPLGGFSIWVQTELTCSDTELLQHAIDHGVVFDPGCLFRVDGAKSTSAAFRLSYSATPIDQIGEGVARLARMMDDLRALTQRSAAA